MSYIRCLSNPESLYVWSNGEMVHFHHGVRRPHSSGRPFLVPHRVFDTAILKWLDYCGAAAEYKGFRIEELHVDAKTAEVFPEGKPCKRCVPHGKHGYVACKRCSKKSWDQAHRGRFVVRVSYKGNYVDLWRVTWDYVTRGVERRKNLSKKERR